MGRFVPLLIACLLLSACSIDGPGAGATYWAISGDDDFGAYLWKPLLNAALTVFYVTFGAAYILIYSAAEAKAARKAWSAP